MKKIFLLLSIPILFIIIGFYHLTHGNVPREEINYNNNFNDNVNEIDVLFSMNDDIRKKIISLIQNETKEIWCAAFRLTDSEITKELILAYRRGVKLIFIVDREGFSSLYSKFLHIFKEGISIFISPQINDSELNLNTKNTKNAKNKRSGIMHNKFFIFHGQLIILTGSYNFTKSAQDFNQENVVIIKNLKIFTKYSIYFQKLCDTSSELSISNRIKCNNENQNQIQKNIIIGV